jgi:hypothetical protein
MVTLTGKGRKQNMEYATAYMFVFSLFYFMNNSEMVIMHFDSLLISSKGGRINSGIRNFPLM